MPEIPITTKETPIANPNRLSLKWWVNTIIAVLVVNPFPEPETKVIVVIHKNMMENVATM